MKTQTYITRPIKLNIAALMEVRGWSPEIVSEESRKYGDGISKQGVYDLLNPLRQRVGMKAITALCDAFQCEPGELFTPRASK